MNHNKSIFDDSKRYQYLKNHCIKKIPGDREGPSYTVLEFKGAMTKDWKYDLDHMDLDAAIDKAINK